MRRDVPPPASIVERRILKALIAELLLRFASESGLIGGGHLEAALGDVDMPPVWGHERRHPKVALALELIDAEAATRRSQLKPIAAAVGLSPWHLSRLMKGELGCTLRDYVREARVGRAAALLSIPSKSVKEIAIDLGYQDSSTLAREFRRQRGQSPSQWRRERRI